MKLPAKPSPRAIINYIKCHHPELMDDNDKIRDFCLIHYPNIDYRMVESTVRERRQYENKLTPLQTKMNNMLPGIQVPGINA